MTVPGKAIERLSLYRRVLRSALEKNTFSIYSHDLAEKAGATAAQVRRDLMAVGFTGSSRRGYEVRGLMTAISRYLDNPHGEPVALVGVGNLGRALLPFLLAHGPHLKVCAAFDTDPLKTGRVIHGCMVYPIEELEPVVRSQQIQVAILAVPASAAQPSASRLISLGVCGIINFAPIPLRVPEHVTVENIDMTIVLEKVAFLARQSSIHQEKEVIAK